MEILAWPEASPIERRWIVRAGLIQHRHWQWMLEHTKEALRERGLDLETLAEEILEYIDSSSLANAQEISETAAFASDHALIMRELEGRDIADIARIYIEAHARTEVTLFTELTQQEGMEPNEAAQLLEGPLRSYADEFQEVFKAFEQDEFGWTPDEHLQFAIERRQES